MTLEYITASIPLDSLTPFAENAKIFKDSFSPESLGALADDVFEHGLSQPPLTADVEDEHGLPILTIVDGERRWRAVGILRERHPGDPRWQMIPHRHLGAMTRQQVLDRILDCFSSVRHGSPRERAAAYELQVERLQREHGVQRGRGSQSHLGGSTKISPAEIYAEAAKRVGISSEVLARQMVRIFRDATPEVQHAVNRGDLSVSAAIDTLRTPKPPKVEPASTEGSNVVANPFTGELSSSEPTEAASSDDTASESLVEAEPANDVSCETSEDDEKTITRTNGGRTPAIHGQPGEDILTFLARTIEGSGRSPSIILSLLCSRFGYVTPPRQVERPTGKAAEVSARLAASELGEAICSGLMLHFGFAEAAEPEEDDDEDVA
jgi:hypothetical protein